VFNLTINGSLGFSVSQEEGLHTALLVGKFVIDMNLQ
jgi:hypothetical protein